MGLSSRPPFDLSAILGFPKSHHLNLKEWSPFPFLVVSPLFPETSRTNVLTCFFRQLISQFQKTQLFHPCRRRSSCKQPPFWNYARLLSSVFWLTELPDFHEMFQISRKTTHRLPFECGNPARGSAKVLQLCFTGKTNTRDCLCVPCLRSGTNTKCQCIKMFRVWPGPPGVSNFSKHNVRVPTGSTVILTKIRKNDKPHQSTIPNRQNSCFRTPCFFRVS